MWRENRVSLAPVELSNVARPPEASHSARPPAFIAVYAAILARESQNCLEGKQRGYLGHTRKGNPFQQESIITLFINRVGIKVTWIRKGLRAHTACVHSFTLEGSYLLRSR